MALLTAQGIADVALPLLRRQLALPRTVTMVSGGDFSGPNGSTITVRVPVPTAARTQTAGSDITFDDLNEVPVNVTLSHLYHGHLMDDEEANLELVSFSRQILLPQVASVAIAAEGKLATVMNDLTDSSDIEWAATASSADTIATILEAREFLSESETPADERYCAVAPDIATRILSVDNFVRADASGSTDALRNAVIGRLYGFTFVESTALEAGSAVFYHRSGFVFANRTPQPPRSDSADSATASDGGVGLRTILQYVPTKLSEASIVSTFAGAAAVKDEEGDSPSDFDSPDDQLRYVKVGTASS